MNQSELQTFLTIVETASLVRASRILNVTQSTVTARLKALEDEIGQTLINRSKSGATMTAAGVRLHRYADTICNLWQQAKQETALPDGMSSTCNIACEYDLWVGLGQMFFEKLQQEQPQIAVSIWLGSASDVNAWLNSGKSDLALTYRSSISQNQKRLELVKDDLVLVSTKPDSPLKYNSDYIYIEAGEAFGRAHAAVYADAYTARISFGNASLGLEYLLKQGGSAYLPLRMVSDVLNKGQLYLIKEPMGFQRQVYLSYNQSAQEGWVWFDAMVELMGVSL